MIFEFFQMQSYEKEISNLKTQLREKSIQERRKKVELQELQEHVVELKKLSSQHQNIKQEMKKEKPLDLPYEGEMLQITSYLDQTINVVETILKDHRNIYLNQTFECNQTESDHKRLNQNSSPSSSSTEEEKEDSTMYPKYNDEIIESILKEYDLID